MSILSIPQEHKLQLEVFEGPLDLLLYLIKRDEVDIYDIPIVRIADQYMEYLDLMRMLDLGIAGEFLVMAATLMLIKSRMLLPPAARSEEEPEEEEDPRWELVRQLIEYRKFKEAATFLQGREARQENVFAAGVRLPAPEPEPGLGLDEVSLFDLLAAFNSVLKRVPVEDLRDLFQTTYSITDKIEAIMQALAARASLTFHTLFENMTNRQEIVCTFLALLELVRLKQVRIVQETAFGEILVTGVQE